MQRPNLKLIQLLLFTLLVICSNTSIFATTTYLPDTSSQPISFSEFEEKMEYYTDMMKQESEFTTEEYIEMVLIDNTYFTFLTNSNPRYKVHTHNQYLDFLQHYKDDIILKLEATEQGCNGGNYSSKYNLCIGGISPSSQSIYAIID